MKIAIRAYHYLPYRPADGTILSLEPLPATPPMPPNLQEGPQYSLRMMFEPTVTILPSE
jgi:hypothetical protein